jgi:hypothetical protein
MLGGGSLRAGRRLAPARHDRVEARPVGPPPSPEWLKTRELAEALAQGLEAIEAEDQRETVPDSSEEPEPEAYLVVPTEAVTPLTEPEIDRGSSVEGPPPAEPETHGVAEPRPERAPELDPRPAARTRKRGKKETAAKGENEAPHPAVESGPVTEIFAAPPSQMDEIAVRRRQLKAELRGVATAHTAFQPSQDKRRRLFRKKSAEGNGVIIVAPDEQPPLRVVSVPPAASAPLAKGLRCRSCGEPSQWGMCETCSQAFGELKELSATLGVDWLG